MTVEGGVSGKQWGGQGEGLGCGLSLPERRERARGGEEKEEGGGWAEEAPAEMK